MRLKLNLSPEFMRWARRALWGALLVLGIVAARTVKRSIGEAPGWDGVDWDAMEWEVSLVQEPSWLDMDPSAREELCTIPLDPECIAGRERGIASRVASFHGSSPWVKEVRQVRVEHGAAGGPGRIFFDLRLRRPVACVRVGKLCYLVDSDARRLSRALDVEPYGAWRVPTVLSRSYALTVPPRGSVWHEKEVGEGVAVAALLWRFGIQNLPVAIAEVDISGVRRAKVEIVLRTESGFEIEWGRSPLSPSPRVRDVRTKVYDLERVLRDMAQDSHRYRLVRLWVDPPVLVRQGLLPGDEAGLEAGASLDIRP